MKMTRTPLRRICIALAGLGAFSLACGAPAARPADDDESDLPLTVRSNYVAPIVGPADDTAYARGALGLVRHGYGRASLFVAWRVMQLPPGALARESHDRKTDWLHVGLPRPQRDGDQIEQWLRVRGELVQQAPAVAPDYFRQEKRKLEGIGEFDATVGQCGPHAYAFATQTLRELKADAALTDDDRRTWIAGQDAVFARCSWVPGTGPAPALPALLPASAAARLRQLNAYQHAAALFYGDDYAAARREFDAIAAVPGHPMRPWAALGALRCLVREAVRDAEWEAATDDAWNKRKLRDDAYRAAIAPAAARRRARLDASAKDFSARMKAAEADASLAVVRDAMRYTARRASLQLTPWVVMDLAMKALDLPLTNPYTVGALDLFQELYPRVAPDRPVGDLAADLRKYAWFDFVVTVQGCSDVPKAPDAAICDAEHAHAQARWQETKHNAWLLATLMTARQPSAADLPAAEAARAVPAERPEWASLQFYAARVLRAQGREAHARTALEAVAASPTLHKRERPLVEAALRAR